MYIKYVLKSRHIVMSKFLVAYIKSDFNRNISENKTNQNKINENRERER